MATPSTRIPVKGVMKCLFFLDPGHHYYKPRLCEPWPKVVKNIVWRNTSILQFYPQIYLPIMAGVHNMSLYPTNAINQIRLAKKSFIRCYRTTHDEGRLHISIGNLSNSDDLKM